MKDCRIMAEALQHAGVAFNQIYCSVAQRAQLTIQGLAECWQGCSFEWQVTDSMYVFSSSQIWQFTKGLDDDIDQVCLVGHNPAMTDFINQASAAELENFPTCAYAKIRFPTNLWSEIDQQQGELIDLLRPKMFK